MQLPSEELNFQRLLHRCKKLSRDALSKNRYRLQSSIEVLEVLFVKLQDAKHLDSEILMQYGRELQNLKVMIEIEKKRTTEEKLAALAALPKTFSTEEQTIRRRRIKSKNDEDKNVEVDNEEKVSNATIKVQNEAIYKADIRRQLMSGSKAPTDVTSNMQEGDFITSEDNRQAELSEELLRLTTALKQNAQVAGTIIKEDNMTLTKMQQLSEQNRTDLGRESERLEHYAKRSCIDCMMILTVVMVVWVFLGCVLIMKFFRKRI